MFSLLLCVCVCVFMYVLFAWKVLETYYRMDMSLSKLWEVVKDREVERAVVHGVAKSQIRLSDWTTAIEQYYIAHCVSWVAKLTLMDLRQVGLKNTHSE